MDYIKENLEQVEERIKAACSRSGRDRSEVLLVAVTKLHSPEEMNTAIAAGVTDIGENKVQEIQAKYEFVPGPVNWHLIGHLQTNKVKYIADKVKMIHSVDSFHLAQEIDKRCGNAGRTMDILIQVNAAAEESKSGIEPGQAKELILQILENCPNIRIKGLMEVAPAAEDPNDVRPYFRQVKELFDSLKAEISHPNADFVYLSMGMSHDFEVAIEEGSNIVRVGTAIFGARDYSKDKKSVQV